MRILDVSPKDARELDGGSVVRSHNLLRHLSHDHCVQQFSLAWPRNGTSRLSTATQNHTPSFREHCYSHPVAGLFASAAQKAWVGVPAASGAALRVTRPRLLDELLEWADVVLVEFPFQFEYCRSRGAHAKLVLAAHNVEAQKFPSWARAVGIDPTRSSWVRYVARAERSAAKHADLIVAVSEADRDDFAARYGVEPNRMVVVPNGADTERYTPTDPTAKEAAKQRLGLPDATTVMFAGADVPPNRAGLKWVEEVAARLPHMTFVIVGSVGKPARRDNTIVTGFVHDFRSYLEAADIAICPIEHGGGTKIKLLESLAAGLPTVAFAETLRGTDVHGGEHVLVADKSVDALAAAVQSFATDGELAVRFADAGRALVVKSYSWRASARRLEAALTTLAAPA